MIISAVRSKDARAGERLDARYFCSPGVAAFEALQLIKASGTPTQPVAGAGGLGTVAATSRTKRVYAGPGEPSVPYLRPYDVFDYLPQPADMLSQSGTQNLDQLMPQEGSILQTCSGRNLGPLAYVDAYIARFAVSDDVLRLAIEDETNRFYALAFLSTSVGQALLTRSKTGAVIDHLSAKDLGEVEVPFISAELTETVAGSMRVAVQTREKARVTLAELIRDYGSSVPDPQRDGSLREGWTTSSSHLSGRLDAAFHDPLVRAIRSDMTTAGGVRCGDHAELFIPGRYTRYYVAPEYGRPILSGRQLLQAKPVNLRHIAPRSVDYSAFALHEGMLAFGAEGRAEDRIAMPAYITGDRDGWLANNHVMRLSPRPGVNAGWLFLAFAVRQTQAQVKACSCGSVVDAVYPTDLAEVILPPVDDSRGDAAVSAWLSLAGANAIEADAIAALEVALATRLVRR